MRNKHSLTETIFLVLDFITQITVLRSVYKKQTIDSDHSKSRQPPGSTPHKIITPEEQGVIVMQGRPPLFPLPPLRNSHRPHRTGAICSARAGARANARASARAGSPSPFGDGENAAGSRGTGAPGLKSGTGTSFIVEEYIQEKGAKFY
jgi:hypothetical protein